MPKPKQAQPPAPPSAPPSPTARHFSTTLGRIGRLHIYNAGHLEVAVRVIDVRHPYGRFEFEVTPLHGGGSAWVNGMRVSLDPDVAQVVR